MTPNCSMISCFDKPVGITWTGSMREIGAARARSGARSKETEDWNSAAMFYLRSARVPSGRNPGKGNNVICLSISVSSGVPWTCRIFSFVSIRHLRYRA